MPLTKKGQSILRNMMQTYHSENKAKEVFHKMANSGKLKGVHR